jgi:malic enzyme
MNDFKLTIANHRVTKDTSLQEICLGADVLIGVSGPGIFTYDILMGLNKEPIIFAMANPEPEILPELAK